MSCSRKITAIFAMLNCLLVDAAFSQVSVGSPSQVSVGVGNSQPAGTSGSPVAAPNSGLLVFRSDATNLVPNDTAGFSDVFLFDPASGISRVSTTSSGVEINGDSRQPSISPLLPDRSFGVVFQSTAPDLVASPPNTDQFSQIYLKLYPSQQVFMVSQTLGGEAGNALSSVPSVTVLSSPTRYLVTFESTSTNFVAGDTPTTDIFLATVTVTAAGPVLTDMRRVTNGADGSLANSDSHSPVISKDGNYIAFASTATNLIPGRTLTANTSQVYLYDTRTGLVSLVSHDKIGAEGRGNSFGPRLSFMGDFVAYMTAANNIVAPASSQNIAAALYSKSTDETVQVNTASDGTPGDGSVQNVDISANARFVTFSDDSSNLVSNDTNGVADVYLKDRSNDSTIRVSVAPGGAEATGASDVAALGALGYNSLSTRLGFRSFADNLASVGDGSVGNVYQSSVDLPAPPITANTILETPPDLLLKGRRINITLQPFTIALPASASGAGSNVQAASSPKVTYDVRLAKIGSRNHVCLITRRNQINTSKLPPGQYDVRYRVSGKTPDAGTVRTGFSPKQRIQIPKR